MKLTDAELLKILSCGFAARYSGKESAKFWREVGRHKERSVYDLACALQDLEHRVLSVVNADVFRRAEAIVRKKRKMPARGRSDAC